MLAPIALMVGLYVWRFREVRREARAAARRPRSDRAAGARVRRRRARPAGRARLAHRRPRRGLPLLRAHGPARAARRHRAAAAAALALARDPPAGHAPADARRARARPAREPAGRRSSSGSGRCTSGTSRRSTTPRSRTRWCTRSSTSPSSPPGVALWWPLVQPIPMRHALTGPSAARLHRRRQGRPRRARAVPRVELHRPLPVLRGRPADLGPQRRRGPERRRRDHDGRAVDDARARDGLAVRADAGPLRGGGAPAGAPGRRSSSRSERRCG